MKLNNYAYVHKKIRLLCYQLAEITGIKCITDLSEEFEEIRFMDSLSYIVIDFKREAYYVMSVNLDKKTEDTINDIITNTTWLYLAGKWQKRMYTKSKKKSSKKH